MSSYVSEVVSNRKVAHGKSLPSAQARGRSRFHMMVHPDKWTWRGDKYIPKLGKLSLVPGVQGVSVTRNGQINDSAARAYFSASGWVVIENGDARLASVLPEGSYLKRYRCANGRWAHVYAWQSPSTLLGRTKWKHDEELAAEVIGLMLDIGMIAPMSIALKEHHLQTAIEQFRRAENTAASDNNTINKARALKRKKMVTALTKDLEAAQLAEAV